jgi:hypothetical protein
VAQPLAQLLTACLGTKATLDAALTTEGLTALTALDEQQTKATDKLKAPCGTVSLSGPRQRVNDAAELGTMDRLTVTWEFRVDGPESTALRYEGALTSAIRGLKATIDAAVTTATVFRWELTGGSVAGDADRMNVKHGAWLVTITVRAEVEW